LGIGVQNSRPVRARDGGSFAGPWPVYGAWLRRSQWMAGSPEIGRMTVLALSGPGALVASGRQAPTRGLMNESQLGARPKPAMTPLFSSLSEPFPGGPDTALLEIATTNWLPTSHATRCLSRLSAGSKSCVFCGLRSTVCRSATLPSVICRLPVVCLTLACLHRSPLFHPKIRLANPASGSAYHRRETLMAVLKA
jgi:hypothetical protein